MKDILLPYRVCDARYHSAAAGSSGDGGEHDYQVLFATGERWEAIAAARDSGDGAVVVYVNGDNIESVIFINKYRFDLSLQS